MLHKTTTTTNHPAQVSKPENGFEECVRIGLAVAHGLVFDSDPQSTELQIRLPFQCPPAELAAVRQEIARRIQVYSPDWVVTASQLAEHSILMRRVNARNQTAKAGGFGITEVHHEALQHAEAAISAVVTEVQAHFYHRGRTTDGFKVQFNSDTPFYVLQQAARRMQCYSSDWEIVADKEKHSISCKRVPLPD
jgi:hypothetical protein